MLLQDLNFAKRATTWHVSPYNEGSYPETSSFRGTPGVEATEYKEKEREKVKCWVLASPCRDPIMPRC
ncbi:hypothetical protein V1477_008468 [Vespula maculifrons]|uniref:Uncharacterized protein n=1 Tax=Vespula maculifrons TaxID=7453 RepID=A0ABD2CE10_VESMC